MTINMIITTAINERIIQGLDINVKCEEYSDSTGWANHSPPCREGQGEGSSFYLIFSLIFVR